MSSTNRSNARDEHIADYYVTPIEDIELFLNEFEKVEQLDWLNSKILDPCAGGNEEIPEYEAYHPMSYPVAIHNIYNKQINTIDIREDSFADTKGDYLQMKLDYQPNIIITNPPFNQAVEIINKALVDVADNGYVIMLLRVNFFGSKDRFSFFQKQLPKYCFVHHIRIGFTDKKDKETGKLILDKEGNPKKGSTDSIEYCHMVWQKGYKPEFTQLKVI